MNTGNDFATGVDTLIRASRKHPFDPFTRVDFAPHLESGRLCFPEEWVSLYHHPIYASLSDEQRWKLALGETQAFFSTNIAGEQFLTSRMVSRTYRGQFPWESARASEYLQHFIHEENAHTFMLAGWCNRYAGGLAGMPTITANDPELSPIAAELLFYGRVFTLECFLGHLNHTAMRDETIDPTTREVHRCHYEDEVRHIAFDKLIIRECVEELGQDDDPELETVRGLLAEFEAFALRGLYNHRIYSAVGIEDVLGVISEVQVLPERLARTEAWMQKCRTFLTQVGLRGTA